MNRSRAKARGRPRQAAAREREMQQRIVAAARGLFLRDGVEAVSMRNLAGEVGCSPMWLYRYFGSKQEILRQVWDLFFRELFGHLEEVRAASPRARLERLAMAYLEYWFEHPDRFRIVFLQEDLASEAGRRYVEISDIVERYDLFTRVIGEAQSRGELGGNEPGDIAQGLLCVLHGLALNLITISEYPWRDAASLSRLTVTSYLSGLPASGD